MRAVARYSLNSARSKTQLQVRCWRSIAKPKLIQRNPPTQACCCPTIGDVVKGSMSGRPPDGPSAGGLTAHRLLRGRTAMGALGATRASFFGKWLRACVAAFSS